MIFSLTLTAIFWLGCIGIGYRFSSPRLIGIWLLAFLVSTINAAHYLHIFDNSAAYHTYRSWLWSDFIPALSGLLIGGLFGQHKTPLRWLAYLAMITSLIVMIAPWIKPLCIPLSPCQKPRSYRGVCMQTSFSTCGPCSIVNILDKFGIKTIEADVAQACLTSGTGTESWYMARYLRSLGLRADFIWDIKRIQPHSIIGLHLGSTGHFVAVLSVNGDRIEIADSCQGPVTMTYDQLITSYNYQGLALVISQPSTESSSFKFP